MESEEFCMGQKLKSIDEINLTVDPPTSYKPSFSLSPEPFSCMLCFSFYLLCDTKCVEFFSSKKKCF